MGPTEYEEYQNCLKREHENESILERVRIETIVETTKRLLAMELPLEHRVQATGLSLQEVRKLNSAN